MTTAARVQIALLAVAVLEATLVLLLVTAARREELRQAKRRRTRGLTEAVVPSGLPSHCRLVPGPSTAEAGHAARGPASATRHNGRTNGRARP